MDIGPRKDIVQVLSKAIRKRNMKFGVYYSLYEWYNKLFLDDKYSGFMTKNYTDYIVWPDIEYLVKKYRPSLLWCDGDGEANYTYWKSPELLAWLYNKSPVRDEIVVNDRLGDETNCQHGDFYTCGDRYNPSKLYLCLIYCGSINVFFIEFSLFNLFRGLVLLAAIGLSSRPYN